LINLASPEDEPWNKSIDSFVDELERCEALGIGRLVAHPGAHMGTGESRGIRRIARALNTIHRRTRGFTVRTLLETTAGQGTSIGHRFDHLTAIIERVKAPERIGVCVDSCHAFAAGYDLATDDGYAVAITELDEQVGLDHVACVHLNDSKKPIGSRVDRHEHIGKGELGRAAFRHLVNDPRLRDVPMILETPKGQDDRGRDLDRVNLAALRRMVR
jgi:deoxyribonuclease-4